MADAASTMSAPAPVMDVVAPPTEKVEKKPDMTSGADPVDQLAAADQKAQQLAQDKVEQPAKVARKAISAKQPAATHSGGVGLAITATVIIVLGLAALATYAYLQTNK